MRLDLEQPMEIDDARRASRRLAELRREGEDQLERAVKEHAEAERDYRKRLSVAFAENADHPGLAAAKEAKARSDAADARYKRDLAEGMVKVAGERLRGLEREGAALRSLTEWSQRMWDREQGSFQEPYGRQAA